MVGGGCSWRQPVRGGGGTAVARTRPNRGEVRVLDVAPLEFGAGEVTDVSAHTRLRSRSPLVAVQEPAQNVVLVGTSRQVSSPGLPGAGTRGRRHRSSPVSALWTTMTRGSGPPTGNSGRGRLARGFWRVNGERTGRGQGERTGAGWRPRGSARSRCSTRCRLPLMWNGRSSPRAGSR